jgi:hypothetical protein
LIRFDAFFLSGKLLLKEADIALASPVLKNANCQRRRRSPQKDIYYSTNEVSQKNSVTKKCEILKSALDKRTLGKVV